MLILLQRDMLPFSKVTMHRGMGNNHIFQEQLDMGFEQYLGTQTAIVVLCLERGDYEMN